MKKTLKQKSKIKLLRFDEVWHPTVGGDHGKQNALKSGLHTAEWRDLRRRIAAWRRLARETLAQAASV
jgi:hypothetical protein